MGFNADIASRYDEWYQSAAGKCADALEKELFQRLVRPQRGQSLLEVGCGTGHNLEFFGQLGLDVTGIDSSESMLQIATNKVGSEVKVCLGDAAQLEFDDHSFDIVALITSLEFAADPTRAIKEAARVSREKIYIGVLNKASFLSIARRVKGRFGGSIYNQAKFYTIWQVEQMIKETLDNVHLTWESALFFPLGCHRYCHWVDRSLSFHRNPFGSFLGICITKFH